MLDLVFTNIKDLNRVAPLTHVGNSEILAVLLTPRQRPRVKKAKAENKNMSVWLQVAISTLQDCLETRQWGIFKDVATHD